MEIFSDFNTTDEPIILPAGFRFHPTDEELISHYLSPKILDTNFNTKAIGDVDLNKVEPWDLPWRAKMGEKEWYFFCVRDRKYPTGLRTNRATNAGYWKATGKDKEIYRAKILIGMKKTLVFYRGRAPRGEKTNWVMHEYRLEGENSTHNLHKTVKNEWVICRIFKKTSEGKKVHISGLVKNRNCGIDSQSSDLPQLMDLSSDEKPLKNVDEFSTSSSSSKNCDYSKYPFNFPEVHDPNSEFSTQNIQCMESLQDQSILNSFLQKKNIRTEFSLDTGMNENVSSCVSNYEVGYNPCDDQDFQIFSTGPVDLDCLWNY